MNDELSWQVSIREDAIKRDVEQVRAALADVYTPKGIDVWLTSRNSWMGNQRPIDLIDDRDMAPIYNALTRLVDHPIGSVDQVAEARRQLAQRDSDVP